MADLVLLMVDGAFGFEMETFEFLNMCQVHGYPRPDPYPNPKELALARALALALVLALALALALAPTLTRCTASRA